MIYAQIAEIVEEKLINSGVILGFDSSFEELKRGLKNLAEAYPQAADQINADLEQLKEAYYRDQK